MRRRQFVRNTVIFTMGTLVIPETNVFASISQKESNTIDLKPFAVSIEKILISGFIKDFETLQPIPDAKMIVSVKRNRFFPTYRKLESKNGSYTINSGFTASGKISEKLEIKITADGYKDYKGYLYLTKNGCNLHSSEWDYNPNFFTDYCPKNSKSVDEIISKFNFHLLKELI